MRKEFFFFFFFRSQLFLFFKILSDLKKQVGQKKIILREKKKQRYSYFQPCKMKTNIKTKDCLKLFFLFFLASGTVDCLFFFFFFFFLFFFCNQHMYWIQNRFLPLEFVCVRNVTTSRYHKEERATKLK